MKNNNSSIVLYYKKLVKNAIEDLKTKGRRHRQIPNILTLMRLTAPCFIIPAGIVGSVPLILGLTAFFSITDLADGFIARKWQLTSELGETLDAVTDKVFASTLLLTASLTNPILLCNLILEGVIASINTYKKLNNENVKSSIIGKLKTWFLFSLVGIGIASSYFDLNSILNTLIITTTTMQVFTIGSYLFPMSANKNILKKEQEEIVSPINSNQYNFEEKKLQKEKQIEENESLKQLRAMREILVSEKAFLEEEKNKTDIKTTYQKSKTDDLKK